MTQVQRTEYLLLPANRAVIAFALALGFALNVLPWGRLAWVPDFLALVLVFWNVHQPRKVGIGIAFLFGLLMDIHEAALLGEHPLFYSLLSYGAISLHRRVPWFGARGRMLHVLPLLLGAQCAAPVAAVGAAASAALSASGSVGKSLTYAGPGSRLSKESSLVIGRCSQFPGSLRALSPPSGSPRRWMTRISPLGKK